MLKSTIKGKYKKMVTHGTKPTAEDLITLKFLQRFPELAYEYWTQVEVTDGSEIGYIDVLSQNAAGDGLTLVEVKASAKQIDEAIGQVCRYSYLLSEEMDSGKQKVHRWIVCPDCRSSHIGVCKQLGINLVII